jgi:hypothetical protein
LAAQLRRALDAVIPVVEGMKGRTNLAKAEHEIASLLDVVAAMKKDAPKTARVSGPRVSAYSEDRLSLH